MNELRDAVLLERAFACIAATVGGTWNGSVLETAKSTLALDLEADEDYASPADAPCLWLTEIAVDKPGTRLGFRALAALRAFCDRERVVLYVGPIVSMVWDHPELDWLVDAGFEERGDPVRVYRPNA